MASTYMMNLFQCSTCQKNFFRKGDLTRHERLHTGQRPHKCSHCGKSFAQLCGLLTHQNTHTGAKPHLCGINGCKAAFGDPSSCSRHRKEVHGSAMHHICPFDGCPSKIKRRSAFSKHLKEIHGLALEDIINVTGGSRKRRVKQAFSGSFKRTIDERHHMQMAAPQVDSHEFQGQLTNATDEYEASFWSDIQWADWRQQQHSQQQAVGTQAFPESSSLFAGTDFDRSFPTSSNTIGKLYQVDLTPCSTPPSLSHSLTSTPSSSNSSPGSYDSSYPPTPPIRPSSFPPPIIAADIPQLSLFPPALTYSELPIFPETIPSPCGYDATKSPEYFSASDVLSSKTLSPLAQFDTLPQFPCDSLPWFEPDASLFDTDSKELHLVFPGWTIPHGI